MPTVRCYVVAVTTTLVTLFAIACATTATPAPRGTAAGSLAITSAEADTLSTLPTVPPLSAGDRDLLTRMSDANILEHLTTSDSVEVAMAQVARRRSQSRVVSSYARRMLLDHETSMRDMKSIASQHNLPMQIAQGDTSEPRLFGMLDSLGATVTSTDFDRRYIDSQIRLHQHMLAELRTLQTVARDDLLKRHIDDAIPIVRSHLARALTIASAMKT